MKKDRSITSFGLHILAMVLMLMDHMWATVVPGALWLNSLGRIAFPIFAFCIAQGYFHTGNFKKYCRRLLVFALLSEIPMNLMYGGYWLYPFHQNVLWTFLAALLCMRGLDKLREKKLWVRILLSVLLLAGIPLAADLLMLDYGAEGVLTVLLFYLFRERNWLHRLGQLAGMVWLHWFSIKGLLIPITLFDMTLNLRQQGFAILALLPIWCYRGRQGPHNKFLQYAMYAFYPVHMLILGLLQ